MRAERVLFSQNRINQSVTIMVVRNDAGLYATALQSVVISILASWRWNGYTICCPFADRIRFGSNYFQTGC